MGAVTLRAVQCSTMLYDAALHCAAQNEHMQINDSLLFCADPLAQLYTSTQCRIRYVGMYGHDLETRN